MILNKLNQNKKINKKQKNKYSQRKIPPKPNECRGTNLSTQTVWLFFLNFSGGIYFKQIYA